LQCETSNGRESTEVFSSSEVERFFENAVYLGHVHELSAAVEECWHRNHGRQCHGADWELLPSTEDAKSLAVCMGGELLSHVCGQFARLYGQSCG
jgi:hypothetical protein